MNTLRRYLRPEQLRELSLVVIIIVVVVFFGSQIENYFSARTVQRIATSVALIAVVAVGQTLVVLTRNVDLSVGSIVGFTAYFVGQQLGNQPEMPPYMAVFLAVGIGALMGAANGALIAYGRVPAIITTLGTLALYRTLLVEYAEAKTITVESLPAWIVELPRLNLFSLGEFEVRSLVVLAFVIVVLFQLVLIYLPFGRRLYVLCGALAGLGGFMFLARFGTITVVAAQGLELQVVAAVVVGGVNIFGGSGSMLGAALGAVLIDLLGQSLLRWLQISEFWRDAILGPLILLAIATDAVILDRLRALWARSSAQTLSGPAQEAQRES